MTTPSREGMEIAKKVVKASRHSSISAAGRKYESTMKLVQNLHVNIALAIDKAVADEREFNANLALIAGQDKLAEVIRNREAHK